METKYNKWVYILCAFFFGLLGVHSFIAKKPIQGILFIIFTILGWILSLVFIGFIVLSIEGIIILVQIIMAVGKKSDENGMIS